jgi:hypothetical protein
LALILAEIGDDVKRKSIWGWYKEKGRQTDEFLVLCLLPLSKGEKWGEVLLLTAVPNNTPSQSPPLKRWRGRQ